MHKKIILLIFLLYTQCASAVQVNQNASDVKSKYPLLVDDNWLLQHMKDDDIVIVDVRSRQDYFNGHIKGAVSLPSWDTFSASTQLDRLAPATEIKKTFGVAGISGDKHVVVYDGGEFSQAARVIWSLHTYGHEKTSMLTVDYDTWLSAKLPVSIYETKLKEQTFSPVINPARIATGFQTLLATKNKKTTIVDVRTGSEYRGETSRSARYGHIPAAISIDWRDMAISDGEKNRLKSIEDLKEIFSEIPSENSVITYCHKGHEAALAYIALRIMEHDVRLYDGSWFEWGNSTTYPVEGPDTHPALPQIK